MSDLIKKVKIKKQDGTYTDYIPIGVEAKNVDLSNGESLENILNKKPYCYNTVADMQADTKLKVGDMAITLGYYEINDNGSSFYLIRDKNFDDIDNGGSIIILNNDLIAELILLNNSINVAQFGLRANEDITIKFKNLINYVNNSKINIINFNNITYLLDNTFTKNSTIFNLVNNSFKINGNNATISILQNNHGVKLFQFVGDKFEINDLNIDGSETAQDQWEDITWSDISLYRLFYITAKNINFNKVNISNIWGQGMQLYGYENVDIKNCNFTKIGGGLYRTSEGANDNFGDAIYLSGHNNNANINISNIYLEGYSTETGNNKSRGGIVLENLNNYDMTNNYTHLNINNYYIINFNRGIHFENYKSDTVIILNNGVLKNDCYINSESHHVELNINNSIINWTNYKYNGSTSFRNFKYCNIKNCIINSDTASEYFMCQGPNTKVNYEDCTFNSIQKTVLNQGVAIFKRCTFNILNGITSYFNYRVEANFYDCMFNNQDGETVKVMSKQGNDINLYNCTMNNILMQCNLKDTKSKIVYNNESGSISADVEGYYSHAYITINNTLVHVPSINATFRATDDVNSNNCFVSVSLSEGETIPIIPENLPDGFCWRKGSNYLLLMTGINYDIGKTYKFNEALYYCKLKVTSTGVVSILGDMYQGVGNPASVNRKLTFDMENFTITRGENSSHVNRVIYWILPYSYFEDMSDGFKGNPIT